MTATLKEELIKFLYALPDISAVDQERIDLFVKTIRAPIYHIKNNNTGRRQITDFVLGVLRHELDLPTPTKEEEYQKYALQFLMNIRAINPGPTVKK